MANEKQQTESLASEEKIESSQETSSLEQEQDEGLYGWKFHRGPLLAAAILTILFYIFVFLWVD